MPETYMIQLIDIEHFIIMSIFFQIFDWQTKFLVYNYGTQNFVNYEYEKSPIFSRGLISWF